MKKFLFLATIIMAIPSVSLLARGGGDHGGGGHSEVESRGSSGNHNNENHNDNYNRGNNYNHGNDARGNSYYNANRYVGPGYGGGYGGVYVAPGLNYDPNFESDPGEIDDTNALYQSYLKENPPTPEPMQ